MNHINRQLGKSATLLTREQVCQQEGDVRVLSNYPDALITRSGKIFTRSRMHRHDELFFEPMSHITEEGFQRLNLRTRDGKNVTVLVHILVGEAFLKSDMEYESDFSRKDLRYRVRHRNGNRSDNHLENLYLFRRPAAKGYWKLKREDIRTIKQRLDEGERGVELAKEFQVSPSTISRILHRQRHPEK